MENVITTQSGRPFKTEQSAKAALTKLKKQGGDWSAYVLEARDGGFVWQCSIPAGPVEASIIHADSDNLKATLPELTPEQLTDVEAAEKRFFINQQKGILFTNATGTGKTFTGLGIAKRFVLQGRTDILIVTPSNTKCVDWVEDGMKLGLAIDILKDTKNAGQGIVTTTYANFYQNQALLMREWDLLVYDESHKLNQNGGGGRTRAQDQHEVLANTNDWQARKNAERNLSRSVEQRTALREELLVIQERQRQGLSMTCPGDNAREQELRSKIDALDAAVQAEAERLKTKTKVVFLSATPFAYHFSLYYGDGTLFDMAAEDENKGNSYASSDSFFMSNLGYRRRYGNLTRPDAEVNVGLLERNLHTKLVEQGAVVSRGLKLPVDYSRDFIRLDNDRLGEELDRGIEILCGWRDKDNKFELLPKAFFDNYNRVYMHQLLEGVKAAKAIPRIKQHLALGRKVILFHSYKQGAGYHPFHLKPVSGWDAATMIRFEAERERFKARYPELVHLPIQGLSGPVDVLTSAFPDILLFNGDVAKRQRTANVRQFNTDGSGADLILVQMDAGKEGISLHDKTGRHQRASLYLNLPVKPTDCIQAEGRGYRWGTVSNAVNEYLVLGTSFEKRLYGGAISERTGTVENLAMGQAARNLEESFANGVIDACCFDPDIAQGVGGKAADGGAEVMSEWDKALTYYFTSRDNRNKKRWQRQGTDYFATPEPVGLKMVEWLEPEPGQDWLEPSAGHGAIARFFPQDTTNTFIEPSVELASDLLVIANGNTKMHRFEDLYIGNKYDRIAMNPPFGQAGSTARDHLDKAFRHLRDGGRLACIYPWGGAAQQKFEKWMEDTQDAYLARSIDLPQCTFKRAGTQVRTRILFIERHRNVENAPHYAREISIAADDVKELFERLEQLSL